MKGKGEREKGKKQAGTGKAVREENQGKGRKEKGRKGMRIKHRYTHARKTRRFFAPRSADRIPSPARRPMSRGRSLGGGTSPSFRCIQNPRAFCSLSTLPFPFPLPVGFQFGKGGRGGIPTLNPNAFDSKRWRQSEL